MSPGGIQAGSIVVGVDGSTGGDAALAWAAEQAALEQRPLTIVHSVEPTTIPGASGMYSTTGIDYGRRLDDIREAAGALMASATTTAVDQHPGLVVQPLLNFSDPRSTLLELGRDAAMIVVGSRGRGPIASLLLGSVSVSVSKHAECPVVVLRPPVAEVPQQGILLGVDGTADSTSAIDFAYRIASWRALPLTVLHCYWDVTAKSPLPADAVAPDMSDELALVAESLAGMQEKFPDVEVQVRLAEGFADRQLIAASPHYELLVVGHHPTSLLDDLVHGSMAAVVVENAHCTVATVPIRAFPAPRGSS